MGQIKPWLFRAFLKGEEGQQNGVLCSQAGWQRLTLHIDVLVKDFLQTAIFAVWMEMLFPPSPSSFFPQAAGAPPRCNQGDSEDAVFCGKKKVPGGL